MNNFDQHAYEPSALDSLAVKADFSDGALPVSVNNISQNAEQPILHNLNTPTTSECNYYDWPPNEKTSLAQWKKYANDLVIYLTWLERDGPNTDKKQPKKPGKSLQTLLNKHTSKSKPLLGLELHEYLLNHIVDMNNVVVPAWNPVSLETMIPTLVEGFKILKQHNAKLLCYYLDYGCALNLAFDCFSVCKLEGQFSITWKMWIESNIGISDRYAKQIRNIAAEFGSYKRLRKLGISFNEFIKRKEAIRLMFSQFPELNDFWKQDPTQ